MEDIDFSPSGSLRTPCSSVGEIFSSQSEKGYKGFLFDSIIRALKKTVKLSIRDKQYEEMKKHLVCGIDISCDLRNLGISHNFMDNVFVLEARDSLFLIIKYLCEIMKSLSTIATKYSRVMTVNLRSHRHVRGGIISVGEETVLHIEGLKEIMNIMNRISTNMQLSSFCNTIDSWNCFYNLYGGIDQISSIDRNIASSCGFDSTSFNIYTPSYFLDMELISIMQKVAAICIGVCFTFRNLVAKPLSHNNEDSFQDIKISLTSARSKAIRLLEQTNLSWYEQTNYSIHREKVVKQSLIMLEDLLLNLQDIIHYFLNKKVKKQIISLSSASNQVSDIIIENCSKRIHDYASKLNSFIAKNESRMGKQ